MTPPITVALDYVIETLGWSGDEVTELHELTSNERALVSPTLPTQRVVVMVSRGHQTVLIKVDQGRVVACWPT